MSSWIMELEEKVEELEDQESDIEVQYLILHALYLRAWKFTTLFCVFILVLFRFFVFIITTGMGLCSHVFFTDTGERKDEQVIIAECVIIAVYLSVRLCKSSVSVPLD